jgi:hypothetical protein
MAGAAFLGSGNKLTIDDLRLTILGFLLVQMSFSERLACFRKKARRPGFRSFPACTGNRDALAPSLFPIDVMAAAGTQELPSVALENLAELFFR